MPDPCPSRVAATKRVAEVALPIPVRRTFAYRIPDEQRGLRRGCRVNVPFGSRVLTGFVVGFDPDDAPENLKPVHSVLDTDPLVDEHLLALTRWIADRTLCSWGEALRAALPGHGPAKREKIVSLVAPTVTDLFAGLGGANLEDRVLAAVGESGEASYPALAKSLGLRTADLHEVIRQLVRSGKLKLTERISSSAPSGPPRIKVVRLREEALVPAGPTPGEVSNPDELLRRAPVQLRCVEFLREAGGEIPLRDLASAVAGSRGAVKRLVEKKLVKVTHEAWEGRETESHALVPERVLNSEQDAAVGSIAETLQAGKHKVFLLHGVTGSGKTEVYLRAMAEARRQGKQSILLVPEITLTPQTVSRLRGRFGAKAAVVHSRLTDAERRRIWHGARRGAYDVVLGPRSAVFTPLPDLGLIVIDEEHEGAYKQEDAPRYQARDVAIERARLLGAAVVLGSATPDLETFQHGKIGDFEILRLPDRVSELPLPEVRLVDLRGTQGLFSKELLDAIGDRIEKKEQVILFLNRRGFSPFVQCGGCGEAIRCRECAVSLTYHKADGTIRCHYCDHEENQPEACPGCLSKNLYYRGMGTQRVEEELRERFPEMRLARLDSDSVRRQGAHEEILGSFLEGDIDVLLGTQMVAKGLDFPRVTLVGVINADTGLHLPDYRATERTFQVLAQVAGRAGRSELGGEVLIQTRCPDHPCLTAARDHDDAAFRAVEIEQRQGMRYPPFARLAAVLVRGPDLARVEQAAEKLRDRIAEAVLSRPDWTVVLGPAPAPIAKLRGKHRVRLLIKGERREDVRAVAETVLEPLPGFSEIEIVVDIDPLDML